MATPMTKETAQGTNALILDKLEAKQVADNRWLGLCPAHDDKDPSLDIYENASGALGFHCHSRRCASKDIVAAIKTKFKLVVPTPRRMNSMQGNVDDSIINYPAHDSALPIHYRTGGDVVYEYHTAQGEVAFIVHRVPKEQGGKMPIPYFSHKFVAEDGTTQDAWAAKNPPNRNRPLYNLYALEHHRDKPVLIVEGEKTADAGIHMPELSGFVVTTWSGGTGHVKSTDWSPLKDRDTPLYLWPDNDEPGVKAMREIAAKLSNGLDDRRFHILDYSKIGLHTVPPKWDIADEFNSPWEREGEGNPYTFDEMFSAFEPYYATSSSSFDSVLEAVDDMNKWLYLLNLAGKYIFVDIKTSRRQAVFVPYQYWTSTKDLQIKHPQTIFDPTAGKLDADGNPKGISISVVEAWMAQPIKNEIVALDYDPGKTPGLYTKHNESYLNVWPGFPTWSTTPKYELHLMFMDFMQKLIPSIEERTWLIDQIRACFQHPNIKPPVATILTGLTETGKSTFVKVWYTLLGMDLAVKMPRDKTTRFEGDQARALLLYSEEFEINQYSNKEYMNKLKDDITTPIRRIEAKGKDATAIPSYNRFIFSTNSEHSITIDDDDRRFTIIKVSDALKGPAHADYWSKFHDMLDFDMDQRAGLMKRMLEEPITSNWRRPISTDIKRTMQKPVDKLLGWLIDIAQAGELPAYLQQRLPVEVARNFGKTAVRIPNDLFKKCAVQDLGKSYVEGEAWRKYTHPFRIYNSKGREISARVAYLDERGGDCKEVTRFLQFEELDVFRAKLQSMYRVPIEWQEFEQEPPTAEEENVRKLAEVDYDRKRKDIF